MNTITSQLSTLYSLWSSVQLDPLTLNKKIEPVIQVLETLVINERQEKRLLEATIQDMMTYIEEASGLLGVSLENMLDSHGVVWTPDIYPDLNPTWPKQKSLYELYSRLDHEITTRRQHVEEWLMEIQTLCKTLELDYRFKPIKEYQENNLSWATIQYISCTLRDLKQLEKERIYQFNTIMKSIHFYWHMLDYRNDASLDFCENFPMAIDMTMTREQQQAELDRTNDYFHHPSNPFQLTELPLLMDKQAQMKSLFDANCQMYHYSVTKIMAVWDEFNIPLLERPVLPNRLGAQDMRILKDILDGLEPMIKKKFDVYIQQFKEQLIPLWDACLLSELERDVFIASLYEKNNKLEIKTAVEIHIAYLKNIRGEGQALQALMKERKDLIQEMIDFEKKASDPRRLFQASFRLLEEEKWRNSCLPRLLQLDRQLIKAIGEFEKLAEKPVMIGDKRYLDALLDEIADREANQTFFGFLNSDPVSHNSSSTTNTNTTITKRMKSRPASVMLPQKKSSLPSIKARAASAILTPPPPPPKKINPSQSMPLKKKIKKDPPKKELDSTTAYIQSNMNLNKALRPHRMPSLIPTRGGLATTKSA
ncbi:microtubule associated protein-domain-containing protein [Gilbertella persicaria]|uniref:microtubule associated protein-domain-containing protein n=1 Tax=Gilbertella persicaria TaxID=101096 RepID=UPI0022208B7A|nr:microtubule associated protein-domain-containing protein [Gilbertella persicaria]KAI8071171.1 microtubule associated protein-domain-containing protein [Gilbertella persicaria]